MKRRTTLILTVLLALLVGSCSNPDDLTEKNVIQNTQVRKDSEDEMTQTAMDTTYVKRDGINVIYLAGGCFWGIEKLMQTLPGVVSATNGYANGQPGDVPTYSSVSTGLTGYRETVRVEYEVEKVSLDAILFAYFRVIDPTIQNAQGNDRGTQYQTGVYYSDEASGATVERIAAIERARSEKFFVEIGPLERFYDAEEYHQDYLDKNPGGYCHISQEEFAEVGEMIVDPADYPRPTDEVIKAKLTAQQFNVTQEAGTEMAFQNEYWDNHQRGIYMDVVTGEPLFSSSDKFDSGTGWPSFSKGIDINTLILLEDSSYGMRRTEVRSRAGNSHLGHVFYDEPISPSGTRYCINSAALRFVPYEEMEAEGYGYLMEYVQ
jgi:peptide methionine sulfoxide reductase msrA/msrB